MDEEEKYMNNRRKKEKKSRYKFEQNPYPPCMFPTQFAVVHIGYTTYVLYCTWCHS